MTKAITSASSNGDGWRWRGGERWTDDGFPLNTGQVTDQRDGLGQYVYSLHPTDDSFVWDAGLADESHRVLCRDWIHSSPHTHKIAIRFAAYFMKAPRAAPVCQRPRPSGTLGLARDVPLCPRRTQTAVCGCTAPRVRALCVLPCAYRAGFGHSWRVFLSQKKSQLPRLVNESRRPTRW